MKSPVEVCLSPVSLGLYDFSDKIVVVVDIFRASATIITALAHGASRIRAVSTIEEAFELQGRGYLAAGERGGRKVEGFDLGNSPLDYVQSVVTQKAIALTTTNGTQSINASRDAKALAIGSFLNISALARYLKSSEASIMILCAGWKGFVNLEDTLFAGALISELGDRYMADSDSSKLALEIYLRHRHDMLSFLRDSDHARRLIRIGYEKDLAYCLTRDLFHLNAIFRDGEIVAVG